MSVVAGIVVIKQREFPEPVRHATRPCCCCRHASHQIKSIVSTTHTAHCTNSNCHNRLCTDTQLSSLSFSQFNLISPPLKRYSSDTTVQPASCCAVFSLVNIVSRRKKLHWKCSPVELPLTTTRNSISSTRLDKHSHTHTQAHLSGLVAKLKLWSRALPGTRKQKREELIKASAASAPVE